MMKVNIDSLSYKEDDILCMKCICNKSIMSVEYSTAQLTEAGRARCSKFHECGYAVKIQRYSGIGCGPNMLSLQQQPECLSNDHPLLGNHIQSTSNVGNGSNKITNGT